MKRVIITGMLILFSISFCGAQSIQEQKRLQEQQQKIIEEQKKREAEAAAVKKKQEELAKKQADEAEIKERKRLSGMQLTLDDIFYLINAEYVSSINTFLTSREWETFGRELDGYENLPEYKASYWNPKSSLFGAAFLPNILVLHLGSFDNLVEYYVYDKDYLRRLENEIKAKGYQEIPRERSIFIGAEKTYRNDQYEVGVSYSDNSFSVLNYKDIEFYRAEYARLEKEAFERANQPATLHLYRIRNRSTLGGLIGLVPRYDVLLDNVVVGNSNANWKTTTTVTNMGPKTVSATIDGRSAEVQINFEPGGVYYVRSDISSFRNDTGKTRDIKQKDGTTKKEPIMEILYTPTLQLVDKSVGEREYDAIK